MALRAERKQSKSPGDFRTPHTARKRISHAYVPLEQQLEILDQQIKEETASFEEELASALELMDQFMEQDTLLGCERKLGEEALLSNPSAEAVEEEINRLPGQGLEQLASGMPDQALQTYLDLKLMSGHVSTDAGDELCRALWDHFKEALKNSPKNSNNSESMSEGQQKAFLSLCAIGPAEDALNLFCEVRSQLVSLFLAEFVPDGCEELPWPTQLEEATEVIMDMITEDWPVLSGQNSKPEEFTKPESARMGSVASMQRQSSLRKHSSPGLRALSSASLISATSGLRDLEAELPNEPWQGPLSPLNPTTIANVLCKVYLENLAGKAASAVSDVFGSFNRNIDDSNQRNPWIELKCVCAWMKSVPAQILKVTQLYPQCDSECWSLLPVLEGQISFPAALSNAWGDLLASNSELWGSMDFGSLFKKKVWGILESMLNADQKHKFVDLNLDIENMEHLLSSFQEIMKILAHSKAWVLRISALPPTQENAGGTKNPFGPAEEWILKNFQEISFVVEELHSQLLTEEWVAQPPRVLGRALAFVGEIRHALSGVGAELALAQLTLHIQLGTVDFSRLTTQLDKVACALVRVVTEKALHVCEAYLLPEVETNAWHHHQPFMRNSRCSYGVRAWGLHLRTLCLDLAPCLRKPKTQWCFRDAVGRTLQETLLRLTTRYLCLSPARARMKQYRIDLSYLAVTSLIIASTLEHNHYHNGNSDEEEDENAFIQQVKHTYPPDIISITPPGSTLSFLKEIYSSIHIILTVLVLMTGPAQDVSSFLSKAACDEVEFISPSTMDSEIKNCIKGIDFKPQLESMLGYLNSMEEFNPAYENQKLGKKASKKAPTKESGSLTHDDLVNLQVHAQRVLNPCILSPDQVSFLVSRRSELQHWEPFPILTSDENEAAKHLTKHLDKFNQEKCGKSKIDERQSG